QEVGAAQGITHFKIGLTSDRLANTPPWRDGIAVAVKKADQRVVHPFRDFVGHHLHVQTERAIDASHNVGLWCPRRIEEGAVIPQNAALAVLRQQNVAEQHDQKVGGRSPLKEIAYPTVQEVDIQQSDRVAIGVYRGERMAEAWWHNERRN